MKPQRKTFPTLCVVVLTAAASICAQTILGRISGTVSDASGAVLPGAAVTVTSEATGQTRLVTTDGNGFYLVTDLPVGAYTVDVALEGFRKAARTGNNLDADGRLTVNFALEPGGFTEAVMVTASAGETVNSVSGEVAHVIDRSQIENLALNGRNYMQLVSMIPGVALLDENQLGLMESLSVSNQSVNGNRTNSNHLTVDGGHNVDTGSNGSQHNNVGVDFIEEVSVKTSNFSAEYGRDSGAAINVVTRSGSKNYRGGGFEYLRNDALDATNYFAPVVDGTQQKGKLRFNDFGWNLGGPAPVATEKLFFFAGEEWKLLRQDTSPSRKTIPTRAERTGDFNDRGGNLFFPGTRTPIPNRNIAALMTPDGRAIAAVYNAMEKMAASYVDRPISNNATFQLPNPLDYRQDIVRIDYRFSGTQSIYGRFLHDYNEVIDPYGTFIGSGLPTIPTDRFRPGTSYQIAHRWISSEKLINESKFNTSWNSQEVLPYGDVWKRSTYGFAFPELFAGGRFRNGIPDVSINGETGFKGPAQALHSPSADFEFSDTLTTLRGRHSIKMGALVVRNRKDQNGRPAYTGSLNFNASGNSNTTGNSIADALLGNFRTYDEASGDPLGFFRFTQIESYVSDNWKAHRRLSLELGIRYQYQQPTYTQGNNIVNFDPRAYDPARAVRVLPNGALASDSQGNIIGNPYNGLVRAGDGVPLDQLGRVPNGNSAAVLAVPAGAPRGLYRDANLWAPRFSFAWTPFDRPNTAVRGGFGIFYGRAEGNLVFSQLNFPPFTPAVQFENGNLSAPAAASPGPVRGAIGTLDAINPDLKFPYTMSSSLSVQHEFPHGWFAEAAYVGNFGRHLVRQPDINQPSFAVLDANNAIPSSQRPVTDSLRPYQGYSSIRMYLSDSVSNYNALQLHATRRKGNLTLSTSYTWSRALADSSGIGDNPEAPYDRRYSYGPASFDRPHVFVQTYTYEFPRVSRMKGLGSAVSGWQVSGVTRAQSGPPLTVLFNDAFGIKRRADYLGGNITVPNPGPNQWFNPAAFGPAPAGRLGNAGVGTVLGPGLYLWDFSLRKSFDLSGRGQGARRAASGRRAMFQADLFNAFNRPNFRGLSTDRTSGNYDTITSAGPARNIQIGLKLSF